MRTRLEAKLQGRLEAERMAVNLPTAAKELSVSERTLWQLARDGKVPCKKVGGQWRFSLSALRQWMTEG